MAGARIRRKEMIGDENGAKWDRARIEAGKKVY